MGRRRALVVGGGVFGLAGAIELRERAWSVTVVDARSIPNPEASSSDVSKLVRMDYGTDLFYHEFAEAALEGWERWNRDWPRPLFHETGFLLLSAKEMKEGGFEHDSYETLKGRGYRPVRLAAHGDVLSAGPWKLDDYADGYLSRRAGWVEANEALVRLRDLAEGAGVEFRQGAAKRLALHGARATGVILDTGSRLAADATLIATGAWTPNLVPELKTLLSPVAQPVLHFAPRRPELYRGVGFPPWAADTARAGWYGFPARPDGSVKVGHHGRGVRAEPDSRPPPGRKHEARTRDFLKGCLPDLAVAPLVASRTCMYCDSADGDFLIARHPQIRGFSVAAGGSGHGFKFVPVLGELVADAVEGRENPRAERFKWRTEGEGREASRSTA